MLCGLVLRPHAYRQGLRPPPLALSASCIASLRCAKTHAAKAALRQIGWNIFYRLPHRLAASVVRGFPSVQWPEVCPLPSLSECSTDTDLIYRLPHRTSTTMIISKLLLRRFAMGAVCPLRASPECFSWFYLCAVARVSSPNWAFFLRPRAPPADAGEPSTPIKKRGSQAPLSHAFRLITFAAFGLQSPSSSAISSVRS